MFSPCPEAITAAASYPFFFKSKPAPFIALEPIRPVLFIHGPPLVVATVILSFVTQMAPIVSFPSSLCLVLVLSLAYF